MTAAARSPDSASGGLAGDWQQRLRAELSLQPDHRPDNWRLGGTREKPTSDMLATLVEPLRPSAVLVPIVEREQGATVLLTVRAAHLRHHAGQISFPGGRLDEGDVDPLAAALRETQEEIGVAPTFVEPWGFLPDHVVLTGFRITPVIAMLRPGFTLQLDDREVAEVFELPLSHLMDDANFQLSRRNLRGFEVEAWDLPFGRHLIWGATAGMLHSLRELLRSATRATTT